MAKTKISEYSSTANSNTDIASINIDEGCAPSGINNAIRALMAQLKDFQTGAAGDSVTVGDVLTVKGASINDTNGNELFKLTATASAVNELTIANAATGGSPTISATGGDTNIGINLTPKGTGGVVFPAGAVGTPSITTSGDLNTGVYFPAADTVGVTTGGTERVRVDSSGNVGIGTSSPSVKLQIGNNVGSAGAANQLRLYESGSSIFGFGVSAGQFDYRGAAHVFYSDTGTERARIDSSGNLLVNTTSSYGGKVNILHNTAGDNALVLRTSTTTYSAASQLFQNSSGGNAGYIQITGASSVSYVTTSDYRLKENIAPMTGALEKVAALKPVTYTWKEDGTATQGFIAHELQAVVPECVVGEKDAVDEDGNPKYQGIDTSFLVATLTAALQELKAELNAAKADIAALKGQ